MSKFLRGAQDRLQQLSAFAQSEGWTVTRTAGGHIKFSKQGYAPIFTSCTASDYRAERNAIARLRRASLLNKQPS
nr:hypothetical protein [Pseudomonas spelaei]